MKQLLVLSGKGGTGKTTVASALIHLIQTRTFADCDVDAPNLHITTEHKGIPEEKSFLGGMKATIDQNKCVQCGRCVNMCRFYALHRVDGEVVQDPFACEGCGVCAFVCPVNAITMSEESNGKTILYTDDTVFSTAKLKMGAGASGKLVSEVKKNLKVRETEDIAVIDGSPGIGCPVIASMSGVNMVLIVTEPTVSGMSDLQRILETAKYFQVETAVCINKYDIHLENTEKIKQYCKEHDIPVAGMIPFDKNASKAINEGKSIVEIDCAAGNEVRKICKFVVNMLEGV